MPNVLVPSVTPTPTAGLVHIRSITIGTTVSSVEVTNVFSSTYDNYYINVVGGVFSTGSQFNLTLGSTTSGYYSGGIFVRYNSTTVNGDNKNNVSSFEAVTLGTANGFSGEFILFGPNLATTTGCNWKSALNAAGEYCYNSGGFQNSSTQFTGFTLTKSTGTATGGTISVYGYKK
jgi:hypothetical protein